MVGFKPINPGVGLGATGVTGAHSQKNGNDALWGIQGKNSQEKSDSLGVNNLFSIPEKKLPTLGGYTPISTSLEIPNFKPPVVAKLLEIAEAGFRVLPKKAWKALSTPPLPMAVSSLFPPLVGKGFLSLPEEWMAQMRAHFSVANGADGSGSVTPQESAATQAWRTTTPGIKFSGAIDKYKKLPETITPENYQSVISAVNEISKTLDIAIQNQLGDVRNDIQPEKHAVDVKVETEIDRRLAEIGVFRTPSALLKVGEPEYIELNGSAKYAYGDAMERLKGVRGDPTYLADVSDIRPIVLSPAIYFEARHQNNEWAKIFLGAAIEPLAQATIRGPLGAHLDDARKNKKEAREELTRAEGALEEIQHSITREDRFLADEVSEIGKTRSAQIETLHQLEQAFKAQELKVKKAQLRFDAAQYVVDVLQSSMPAPGDRLPFERLPFR